MAQYDLSSWQCDSMGSSHDDLYKVIFIKEGQPWLLVQRFDAVALMP